MVEEKEKEIVETGISKMKEVDKERWVPKTELGKKVKSGEITHIDQILDKGLRILEPEIVDFLLPNLEYDLLSIGQSKGKFGGGKKSIWKQTQKKTKEGNKPKFATLVLVGNKDGYVGIGRGKAKETVPAREKALRKAKLNVIKIRRACGSWACGCGTPHSIPFKATGKCGSVIMTLMPAPKGVGIIAEAQCKKILEFAGIKDIFSKGRGNTKSKLNLLCACFNALKNISKIKTNEDYIKRSGLKEGALI